LYPRPAEARNGLGPARLGENALFCGVRLVERLVRGSRWGIDCLGPDCTDRATFEVRAASPGLHLRCEHETMPEHFRDLSFDAGALEDAREVLSIEQGNLVASEPTVPPLGPLTRCTPPFLLSRQLAERIHGRAPIELDFFAYLECPLSFAFEGTSRVTIEIDGRAQSIATIRYLAIEDGEPSESAGSLELDAESQVLLRLWRDDGVFAVELRSILSGKDG
jgi:hypothetical protein